MLPSIRVESINTDSTNAKIIYPSCKILQIDNLYTTVTSKYLYNNLYITVTRQHVSLYCSIKATLQ